MPTKFLDIVPKQESWSIVDSSKLGTYMTCPRKYFYTYIMGWRFKEPNVHLVFGTAWHLATEHLLKTKYSVEGLDEAKYIFYEHYRKNFDSSRDDGNEPKTPARGLISLDSYAKKFKSDNVAYNVLGTELAGRVQIGHNQVMAFRIDAVLEELNYSLNGENQVIVLDHKTSQRRMSFWVDEWKMSMQILLYIHALNCIMGTDHQNRVKGARIRGAFFYKAKPAEFEEAPVYRTIGQMQAWLTTVQAWYELLMSDMRILLRDDSLEALSMDSFPMNTKSCFEYGRPCEFFDYCSADSWTNPLQKCHKVPLEFAQEWWNPLDDPNIEHHLDLTGVENAANTNR